MRLPSGALWPIPVTLDVSEAFAAALGPGETIALRDGEGVPVAVMEVGETWRPEKVEEARAVYGTVDDAHPGVSHLLRRTHPVYASGRVFGLGPAPHYDHRALRHTALARMAFRPTECIASGYSALGAPRLRARSSGLEPGRCRRAYARTELHGTAGAESPDKSSWRPEVTARPSAHRTTDSTNGAGTIIPVRTGCLPVRLT